jgi:hypothetical protein
MSSPELTLHRPEVCYRYCAHTVLVVLHCSYCARSILDIEIPPPHYSYTPTPAHTGT